MIFTMRNHPKQEDESDGVPIGPDKTFRIKGVAIAGAFALVIGATTWCTTTTFVQVQQSHQIEEAAKASEKLDAKLEQVKAENERHYVELRKAIEEMRTAIGSDRTSTRPFSPDRQFGP